MSSKRCTIATLDVALPRLAGDSAHGSPLGVRAITHRLVQGPGDAESEARRCSQPLLESRATHTHHHALIEVIPFRRLRGQGLDRLGADGGFCRLPILPTSGAWLTQRLGTMQGVDAAYELI